MSELEQYEATIEQLQADIAAAREELDRIMSGSVVEELNSRIDELNEQMSQMDDMKLSKSATLGDEEKVMWVGSNCLIEPSNVKLLGDHGIVLNGYELYVDDYGEVKTRKL